MLPHAFVTIQLLSSIFSLLPRDPPPPPAFPPPTKNRAVALWKWSRARFIHSRILFKWGEMWQQAGDLRWSNAIFTFAILGVSTVIRLTLHRMHRREQKIPFLPLSLSRDMFDRQSGKYDCPPKCSRKCFMSILIRAAFTSKFSFIRWMFSYFCDLRRLSRLWGIWRGERARDPLWYNQAAIYQSLGGLYLWAFDKSIYLPFHWIIDYSIQVTPVICK